MKKTGLLLTGLCVFALLLTVVAVHAQDNANVAGTWELTMAAPQGGGGGGQGGSPQPQTLTITQDGTKLSGTLAGGRGGDAPIDGTVSGNDVTFTIQRTGRNGNAMTLTYKATVSGDSMTGSMSGGQMARDFTAKRTSK
ncbi:MAG TPA: hypothetical protein VN862_06005 [Candidatus Acidoferrales bacterium]|nr:hypothetical protein [Candidatus Acidoferrales bacterium]